MARRQQYGWVAAFSCVAAAGGASALAGTATIDLSGQQTGKTLQHVGYNMGHYLPGSNTSAWVEYSGVNAFRVWAASSDYEVVNAGDSRRDDLAPWGDGVSSLSTFNNRKTALRNDPLNPSFIDWNEFNSYFENKTQTGRNAVRLNYILGELHDRDIHVIQQTTRSAAAGPITGDGDWAGKWEQWQHYYAMAFHSARNYDVAQFQMYNEPDADANTGQTDWLIRLELASDAVRSAVSDVNRLYNKSLVADVAAPVSAGGSSKVDGNGDPSRAWGKAALQNIRTDYQGNTVNYDIFNTYAAQVYEQTGAGFGGEVNGIKSKIPLYHAGGAAAGQAMPVIFSEFNRHGSNNLANAPYANIDLSTPYVFTDIASTYVNAMAQGTQAMYAFKFSQTAWTPREDAGEPAQTEQPQKTGFHYVSDEGVHDITGATRSSGVVRLFAKGFQDERARLTASTSTAINNYDLASSFDPDSKNYYLFGVNRNDAENHALTFDLSGWDVQPGTVVSVEEVSPGHNGEVTHMVTVPQNKRIQLNQPSRSVWLLTVPSGTPQVAVNLAPSDDARVRNADGGSPEDYSSKNYGDLQRARIGRSGNSAQFDYASYLKFDVGSTDAASVDRAILRVTGHALTEGSAAVPNPILFHVYAVADDAWTEGGITWDNAPNLDDLDAKANGVGTTAFPVGQLTFAGGVAQTVGIDITQFLLDHPSLFDDGELSFALVREGRFVGDADSASSLVEVFTKESIEGLGPQLTLFVPEPGAASLLSLVGLAAAGRRRRNPRVCRPA